MRVPPGNSDAQNVMAWLLGWAVALRCKKLRSRTAVGLALTTALGLFSACGAGAQANEPATTPVLQLEVGMHVNLARAVAVDALGQWAVTASDDKTARVWLVASGAAGPVLRVPVGEGGRGLEGRLQAVAITPNGSTVAVAGHGRLNAAGGNAVYVFERASGRMLRRLDSGSAMPIVTLALSPDARFLALGLGENGGVKVLDFSTGAVLHHDPQYTGSVYALDFRGDGKALLAGAADGILRVYAVDAGKLRAASNTRATGGKLIAQARFSPDGELIALGLEDSPQVLVLDARSLAVVGLPTAAPDGASAFSSLAWSPDGQELWGGGTHRAGNQWLLRVWPRANWSQFADRPIAAASLMALVTLPGQRVLYVSGEPAWGVVDGAAQVQTRATSALANFNSLARHLNVSADGRKVHFWYGYRKPLVEFDLATRAMTTAAAAPSANAGASMRTARTEAPGLSVQNWENRRGTTLNGKPLPLGDLEVARSLSISADGQSFALGSDEKLWFFNAAGGVRWSQRMGSLVWAVNTTADGKWVITALQDGTLRWHRAADGVEVMALLPHADRRRWVLWTPKGYFDAAAGAEALLGWHVNRGGLAAADFYPMATLRERFRRADVIDRVLLTGDEAQALLQANNAAGRPQDKPGSDTALLDSLPPTIELLGAPEVRAVSGGDFNNEARLRLRLRSTTLAPVTALKVRADGRPASIETLGLPQRPNPATGYEERDVLVRFGGLAQQLQLMAENRHGLSTAATLQVRWPAVANFSAGSADTVNAANAINAAKAGNSGDLPVSAFLNPAAVLPLPSAVAIAVTAAATAPATAGAVKATLGVGTAAGAAAGAAMANTLVGGIDRSPRLYVLSVGIGRFTATGIDSLNFAAKDARDFANAWRSQEGKLYKSVQVRLLTDEQATRAAVMDGMDWLKRQVTQHDVGLMFVASHGTNDPKNGYIFITHNFDWKDPNGTGINSKEFKDTTESLAGKALFFIDTCHSGNVLGARTRSAAAAPDVTSVINDLVSADSGVVVFSASTGRQSSLESAAWGNGAFTKSVVEGLAGKADGRKTGRVTHKMLDYYVTERVKELTDGLQSAVTISPNGVGDFPLALTGAR